MARTKLIYYGVRTLGFVTLAMALIVPAILRGSDQMKFDVTMAIGLTGSAILGLARKLKP